MQRVRDRLNWRGSDTLAVEGSALAIAERLEARQPSNAYMVGGGIRPVPLFETVSFAVITIAPRERWLTILPASSFSSHAATISTPREEALRTLQPRLSGVSLDEDPCDPNGTAIIPPQCHDGSGSGPFGVYLPSSFTFNQCHPPGGISPSQDVDQNGILDQCEAELAVAFHPQLQFDQGEGPLCPTQEPYWTTKFDNSWYDGNPAIRIFYALSYHEDCGSPSSQCPADCNGHAGDSEFIIEEVGTVEYPTYDGPHWFLRFVTFSAHYGSGIVDGTASYSGTDVEYANAAPGSNPVSWVARGKHANYRSQAVCDAGAVYYDTCDNPGSRIGLETSASTNLGTRIHNFIDGIGSRQGRAGTEWFWTPATFCGWNGTTSPRCSVGATPYSDLMRDWGF
jgi:hypothetical protein